MSIAVRLVALLLGFGGGVVATLATVADGAVITDEWVPPPTTIVKVEGNKYDGFGIHYYDGSASYPPTDSEALAECEEYDTRVAVVRCKTEVRVWYRDLGQLRRSLRYAAWKASGAGG